MKLEELLKNFGNIFNKNSDDNHYGSDFLELIKERILECDEFEGCTELLFTDKPFYNDLDMVTYKIDNDVKFSGKWVFYCAFFLKKLYNDKFKPVKNNASIGPILYDVETFEPYRVISVKINVENLNDNSSNQKYESIFSDILNNPNEYEHQSHKVLFVRMLKID